MIPIFPEGADSASLSAALEILKGGYLGRAKRGCFEALENWGATQYLNECEFLRKHTNCAIAMDMAAYRNSITAHAHESFVTMPAEWGSMRRWHNITKRLKHNRRPSAFRRCPLCVKSDLEKYGFAFIRIWHQLPPVYLCADHGCALEDACARCSRMYPQIGDGCSAAERYIDRCAYCGSAAGRAINVVVTPSYKKYVALLRAAYHGDVVDYDVRRLLERWTDARQLFSRGHVLMKRYDEFVGDESLGEMLGEMHFTARSYIRYGVSINQYDENVVLKYIYHALFLDWVLREFGGIPSGLIYRPETVASRGKWPILVRDELAYYS
jgi:hypothetical protein